MGETEARGHNAHMTYATIPHLQSRYNDYQLRMLTSSSGQAFDETVATDALTDAGAEMDMYLGQRYILPLVNFPVRRDEYNVEVIYHPALIRICADIAVYRLQTLRPQDDIKDARQRYEDAIKLLHQMARGDVLLNYVEARADVADNSDFASAGGAQMGQPPSMFGRENR